MPLSPKLSEWLIKQGHDSVHAVDLGMHTARDDEILERAHDENRIIITADLDFSRMYALFQKKSPGLILFRGGQFSEAECQKRLENLLKNISEQELCNSHVVIEKHRIRKRSLPIRR